VDVTRRERTPQGRWGPATFIRKVFHEFLGPAVLLAAKHIYFDSVIQSPSFYHATAWQESRSTRHNASPVHPTAEASSRHDVPGCRSFGLMAPRTCRKLFSWYAYKLPVVM
jgi:hypothetical protein